ncbi:hypothetical protein ANASTE_01437 [Anaerofustis stercorihominis DSM 17244]|uniref:Uncharacterized protein n=1 Tax=Anaerofustis stercorihominis DSM 17244 TaxID=445971 RepID=B1CBT8_9FIRM|nr:hypothetical protein ANASTE_01437 [Anaerofustis stercorihominis DSM 17244]
MLIIYTLYKLTAIFTLKLLNNKKEMMLHLFFVSTILKSRI